MMNVNVMKEGTHRRERGRTNEPKKEKKRNEEKKLKRVVKERWRKEGRKSVKVRRKVRTKS